MDTYVDALTINYLRCATPRVIGGAPPLTLAG